MILLDILTISPLYLYRKCVGATNENANFHQGLTGLTWTLFTALDPNSRKKQLFEKLRVLAEQENGMRSIVTTLLLNPDDCESEQQAYQVSQFILDWLTGMAK